MTAWRASSTEQAFVEFLIVCVIFQLAVGPELSRWVTAATIALLFVSMAVATRREPESEPVRLRQAILGLIAVTLTITALWLTSTPIEYWFGIPTYVGVACAYIRWWA